MEAGRQAERKALSALRLTMGVGCAVNRDLRDSRSYGVKKTQINIDEHVKLPYREYSSVWSALISSGSLGFLTGSSLACLGILAEIEPRPCYMQSR